MSSLSTLIKQDREMFIIDNKWDGLNQADLEMKTELTKSFIELTLVEALALLYENEEVFCIDYEGTDALIDDFLDLKFTPTKQEIQKRIISEYHVNGYMFAIEK
jgi:hypothetical protein